MASERTVQPTVKALVFDEAGRVLLLREDTGFWDLPGGRLEHGESFAECLRRECLEEMGVAGTLLDPLPVLAWCAEDKDGNWRAMLVFRAILEHLDLTHGPECEEHRFVAREDLAVLPLYPQTRPLGHLLADVVR